MRLPQHIPAFLLLMAFCCSTANGQTNGPMSLESGIADSKAESLRDLFEQEGYFQGEGEDSLSELLNKARQLDASDNVTDDTSSATPADSNRRNELSDELSDDEPTESLDDSDAASEEDEQQTQAEKEMRAANARQRALANHLQRLQKPIHQVRLANATSPTQAAPTNRAAAAIAHQSAQWVTTTNSAPKRAERYPVRFAHRPLYFEEPNLERCGRGFGLAQNAVSSGHFLFNTAILPYRLATQGSPTQGSQCTFNSRGDCGTCQTFSSDIEPLVDNGKNKRGLWTEAASLAGFTFLLL